MFCVIDHARCSRKRTLWADAVRQMWQTPTLRSTGRESMLRLLRSAGILPLPLKKVGLGTAWAPSLAERCSCLLTQGSLFHASIFRVQQTPAMPTIGRFVRSRHDEHSRLQVALPAVSGTRNRTMFVSAELIMERQEPGEPTRGGRQPRTTMNESGNLSAERLRGPENALDPLVLRHGLSRGTNHMHEVRGPAGTVACSHDQSTLEVTVELDGM